MSDSVKQWLEQLGLGQYAAAFEENDIVWDVLSELDHESLRDLGVSSTGHRLRILKSIKPMQGDRPPAPEASTSLGADASNTDTSLAAWERHPGARKPVTMLFADITGSTALTEKLDAEEAHNLLYRATQLMCEAVENNRGTVCRFMGDGVMAIFGAPVANEHHAVDACEAALEMQRGISEYTATIETQGGSSIKIRVGLHSGEVVVLTVGEGEKAEYDASGPTVPTAARMEQVAQPGEVYLSAATKSLAGAKIETEALEPVSVKGISKPIPVYALGRVRSSEEVATDITRTPFVGRRAEVIQFRGILDTSLEEGYGQTVYVRGEPGIGKTRLVGEIYRIAESKDVACHRGLALPFGVGKGQDAIRALVRSLLGVVPAAGKDERTRAADLVINEGVLEADQRVHLNDLLDLPQSIEHKTLYDAMDRATRANGRQAVVGQLVVNKSSKQPILVVVEDLHWADPVTLVHLAALTRIVVEQPVLLVMTSRIEGDPLDQAWRTNTGASAFVSIELGPLRKTESMELIQGFVDAQDPLAEDCLKRAAGNPLFLEQLLRTAQEGVIKSLPDSIQSLVMARLDRLETEDKRALQCASVIGQRFDLELLNDLLETPSYDCGGLVHHNLVRIEGSGYLFTHALIQEGVYGSLLKRERQKLHKRCAEFFTDSDSVLRAEHLERADDPTAADAFLKAAREQAGQYRFEPALSLTERGLVVAGEEDTKHWLRCLKGELLHELDDVEAAMAAFQEALSEASNDLQRCDAWMGLAACNRVTDDFEGALKLLEYAEPVATRHELTKRLSQIHHLRGNLYYTTGNVEGCREQHLQALNNARQASSVEDEARALGGLADAEYARGRMRSAYEAFKLCVDRSCKIGFGRVEVANRSQMANSFVYLGKTDDVLENSHEAVEASIRVGHLRAEMNALCGICNIAVDIGDAKALGANAERGCNIAKQLQSRAWEALLLSMSAVAHYFDGDTKRAQEVAEHAVRIGDAARAFIGGWTLGVLSVVTDSAHTRIEALREGDEMLDSGMNGSGYLQFVRYAMLACSKGAMWDRLEAYAQMLEDYTRAEALPWSDFYIARSRVLAKVGRGDRSDSTIADLKRLLGQASSMGYEASVIEFENALCAVRPQR